MVFSGSISFIANPNHYIKEKTFSPLGQRSIQGEKNNTRRVRNAAGVLLEFPRLNPFTLPCVCVCVCVRAHVHVCTELYPTLCDPMNCRPPGSFVPGSFQARILEWVAISSSRAPSCHRDQPCVPSVSCPGRWTLPPAPLGSLSLCRMCQTNLRHHFLFRNDGTRHNARCPPPGLTAPPTSSAHGRLL